MTAKQMNEMAAEKVVLVVPQPYVKSYPKNTAMPIITLSRFIDFVKGVQAQ
jgi:hypothetical protein